MIGTCKKCGNAYETTEEDANIPLWCAGPRDRLCPTCYKIIREPSVACPETGPSSK